MKLRLGTRGSHLARTQASGVAEALAELGHGADLTIIRTAGDRSTATSFGSIGPQGVFVREIEHALLAGDVDIAIHSFKDLPTQSPDELTIGAVPRRLDPADVLVMTREAAAVSAEALPVVSGARVGTASARRQAWIRHLRPDITVVPIRGNVPTRIERLRTDLDGVVLAAAGIQRLRRSPLDGVADPVTDEFAVHRLSPVDFVPAPAQGALAIQCRRADAEICELLESLDHAATRQAVRAERALLARVEGGCDLAFGAWCDLPASCGGSPSGGHGTDVSSSGRADQLVTGPVRLVAWLDRDGKILKADTRTPNADSCAPETTARTSNAEACASEFDRAVDSAWTELERQWTG